MLSLTYIKPCFTHIYTNYSFSPVSEVERQIEGSGSNPARLSYYSQWHPGVSPGEQSLTCQSGQRLKEQGPRHPIILTTSSHLFRGISWEASAFFLAKFHHHLLQHGPPRIPPVPTSYSSNGGNRAEHYTKKMALCSFPPLPNLKGVGWRQHDFLGIQPLYSLYIPCILKGPVGSSAPSFSQQRRGKLNETR